MKDASKTKKQLIEELARLRQQVDEFETADERVGKDLKAEQIAAAKYLDIAGVLVIALDRDARLTLINKAGCELVEHKREEILGKNWIDLCNEPAKRDMLNDAYKKIMDGQLVLGESVEDSIITRSGKSRVVNWYNSLLTDNNGNIEGMLCSAADITDLKRAESALRETNQRIDLAAQASGLGIWDTNLEDGRNISKWDQRMFTIFGIDPKGFQGEYKEWTRCIHPDDFDRVIGEIEHLLSGKSNEYGSEYRIIQPSGAIKHLSAAAIIVRNDDGKPSRLIGINLDITDRKEAQGALQESERRFRTVIDQSPVSMEIYSPDGFQVQVNKAWETMWKADPKISIGKFNILTDPQISEFPIYPQIVKAFEGQIQFIAEWYFDPAISGYSARDRYMRSYIYPIKDEDGNIENIVLTHEDITERKDAETALIESEEKHRALIENLTDLILILDKDGINVWNSPSVRQYGLEPEDAVGIRFDKYIHPDDLECVRKIWDTAIANPGKTYMSNHRASGTPEDPETWIYQNNSLVYLPDLPGINGVVSVCRNETEQKKAEIALKKNEEKYRLLFGSIADAIVVHNIDGSILDINHQACISYGYTREQFLNMKLSDLDSATQAEFIPEQIRKVVENGQFEFETIHLDSAGNEMNVEVNSQIVEISGNRAILSIGRNITERRKAEQEKLQLERQVQHAQKLESLGVLAGGIAHDFNNLLMAILGNSDLALYELSPMAPARNNIQEIEKAARRAADLAKQMLAYSGKGRFVVEPLDCNILIEEMVHLLNVSISKKAVLKFNYAQNIPVFDGDATQVRQIIMNLIVNASEAIGDKSGIIALSTGAMECDQLYLNSIDDILLVSRDEPLTSGTYTYFEVADTGCGMSADTIENIFDPFFTTKFTGRGLGMSAVLGIIRGHQGAIKIYSEVGKGSTFKVLFPANSLAETPHPSKSQGGTESEDWSGSGTILMADDEETVCAVGKKMLEKMGFSVLAVPDGREAVRVFSEKRDEITCVLLDLTMPHMDGEETFREIRRITPDVKVILCSGYNETDATQRFVGKGLAGFIQKPFTMATLKKKLMEAIG